MSWVLIVGAVWMALAVPLALLYRPLRPGGRQAVADAAPPPSFVVVPRTSVPEDRADPRPARLSAEDAGRRPHPCGVVRRVQIRPRETGRG